jgi:hypothetical protein
VGQAERDCVEATLGIISAIDANVMALPAAVVENLRFLQPRVARLFSSAPCIFPVNELISMNSPLM